jgi:Sulfotransferase domain
MKTIDTADQSHAGQAINKQQVEKPVSRTFKSRFRTSALSFQRHSAQTFRGLTSSARLLPDFLIIGGQRCGTSSLYYYLTEHPGIAAASTKEIHFFDDFYTRGLNWYRAQFPTVAYKRYIERARGQHFLTGEASPYYLFHPHVPQRVAAALPNAKLIVLLRNPIDRAYSQHWLEVAGKFETLSFEEAVRQEPERTAGEYEKLLKDENYHSYSHRRYTYLTRGIYVDQLQHWMNFYPRNQFLIIKTEDLYTKPAEVVRQTLEFLGVPGDKIETNREYKKYKVPSKTGYKTKDSAPKMDPQLRSELVEYFRPHNARLSEFLGRDFEWDK